METGPGPGAPVGEARVQLPIGSTDAQRSSSTCAVAPRRGRLRSPGAGGSGRGLWGPSWGCRVPAAPGSSRRGSSEAEPPVLLGVEPATQAPTTPPPLLPVLRGPGRATGTDVPRECPRGGRAGARPGRGGGWRRGRRISSGGMTADERGRELEPGTSACGFFSASVYLWGWLWGIVLSVYT